jgi:hypothetical protein
LSSNQAKRRCAGFTVLTSRVSDRIRLQWTRPSGCRLHSLPC